MGIQLEWQVGEEENIRPGGRGRRPVTWLVVLTIVLLVGLLAFAGWRAGQEQAARGEEELRQRVQALLDEEQAAYLAGDGERFFATQAQDPAWLSAQLRPENQLLYQAGLTVTRVEQHGDEIWANVSWPAADQRWQRVLFFQQEGGALRQVPPAESYWGPAVRLEQPWGALVIHEVDRAWAEEIVETVNELLAGEPNRAHGWTTGEWETAEAIVRRTIAESRRPFTLTIAADYQPTAAPDEIRLPSPRLLALDEQGKPGDSFWELLRQRVVEQVDWTLICFAVPAENVSRYQLAAAAFREQQPDIVVEIISLEELPADPLGWNATAGIDGAAVTPTEAMLAAGLVYDLTDLASSDPTFDQGDFYEQIWQGAWWRGRMWFMPQGASMRLLFYDRVTYQAAGLVEPSMRWTWTEMGRDVAALAAAEGQVEWGFVDQSLDTLFSYAFNWDNACPPPVTVRCKQPLQPAGVVAALEWYAGLAGRPGVTPDLTGLAPAEREFRAINLISPGGVAVWVEEPVNYELYSLNRPMGVVPFPGSDRFDGITPLWVRGSFISQYSQAPLATWQWLKFLSTQSLERQLRLVPARPSVAMQTGYWLTLPRPLAEAMRTAFPFAWPVTIEEQNLFSWAQLAAIHSGEITAEEAAQMRPRVRWFQGEVIR
ncbi:MAG: ABC transporter substrate-binding protein [Chloroflexi bacterium]|nr:ABC transporter substrate-binding protein [Chloroflexota bacterium]MCI0732120.1 ABC transporter substrate-binding protein [Chloroflexota bacterium]